MPMQVKVFNWSATTAYSLLPEYIRAAVKDYKLKPGSSQRVWLETSEYLVERLGLDEWRYKFINRW